MVEIVINNDRARKEELFKSSDSIPVRCFNCCSTLSVTVQDVTFKMTTSGHRELFITCPVCQHSQYVKDGSK